MKARKRSSLARRSAFASTASVRCLRQRKLGADLRGQDSQHVDLHRR